MILRSLAKHFPARFPEWLASLQMVMWGCYLVLYPGMMENPNTGELYTLMKQMWSQPTWALFALAIGTTRGGALFVNGAYTRTPLIRVVTAFMSMFVWTQALIGVAHVANLGVVMYVTALIADLYSAYRAGMDAVFAERQRRIDKAETQGNGRVRIIA
jgi:hypothetical protein